MECQIKSELLHINPLSFTGSHAWDALDIAQIEGASVRLHWTDKPYKWHVNDGAEVFVVLDGVVEMKVRVNNREESHHMKNGDIFYAAIGCEHVAHPQGAARILVIKKTGSV